MKKILKLEYFDGSTLRTAGHKWLNLFKREGGMDAKIQNINSDGAFDIHKKQV